MFELIIWIIIICAIYGKAQKRKQQSLQTQGYPQSDYSQTDMAVKQRELKQRPQQKPADILSKAAVNVMEYEADMTNDSRLMDEVNDLILMGYQADLTFSRDFVAEGIKMLNSYEISGI